jgi:hypothetical protein
MLRSISTRNTRYRGGKVPDGPRHHDPMIRGGAESSSSDSDLVQRHGFPPACLYSLLSSEFEHSLAAQVTRAASQGVITIIRVRAAQAEPESLSRSLTCQCPGPPGAGRRRRRARARLWLRRRRRVERPTSKCQWPGMPGPDRSASDS